MEEYYKLELMVGPLCDTLPLGVSSFALASVGIGSSPLNL